MTNIFSDSFEIDHDLKVGVLKSNTEAIEKLMVVLRGPSLEFANGVISDYIAAHLIFDQAVFSLLQCRYFVHLEQYENYFSKLLVICCREYKKNRVIPEFIKIGLPAIRPAICIDELNTIERELLAEVNKSYKTSSNETVFTNNSIY